MNNETQTALMKKLAAFLREELNQKGKASVEGLGTFRVRHLPAQEKTWPNGRVELHPPEDEITFIPDKKA